MAGRFASRKLAPTGNASPWPGAGPSGLTCGFYLALLGHEVTVFESKPEAGGMLRYAIPEYRLPKKVLAREVDLIRRLGVEFHLRYPWVRESL